MDKTDRKIIDLLASDARRSLADIGAQVGLSTSAVNDRVRRLTASGALRNFTVAADPESLGLPVLAFLWLALSERADEAAFCAFAAGAPQIEECHHVTGAWSYLLKLRLGALSDVEPFLKDLKSRGFVARSETMLALSSPAPGSFVPKAR